MLKSRTLVLKGVKVCKFLHCSCFLNMMVCAATSGVAHPRGGVQLHFFSLVVFILIPVKFMFIVIMEMMM